MQFLKVLAKNRINRVSLIYGVPVLINGERNGKTGLVLKLDPGVIEVSVDRPGADRQVVTLDNTSQDLPMEVIVLVGGEPEIKTLPPEPYFYDLLPGGLNA